MVYQRSVFFFGLQANNRAIALAWLRVLQQVHRSRDLHVHTDPNWSYDIVVRLKECRQWRTLNTAEADALYIWAAMVYDVLQQRTGQTLWSHQCGHHQCVCVCVSMC